MLALSVSKVKAWQYCRAQFFRQYILGLREFSPALEHGSDVHMQAELYHKREPYDSRFLAPYTEVYPPDFYDENGVARVEERIAGIHLAHPDTGRKLALPINLVIDGIRTAEPGRGLYDLKTSKVSWSQRRADEDIQATLYCYVWWQLTGELMPFTFIVLRKWAGPRTAPLQTVTTRRTPEEFKALWTLFDRTIAEILTTTEYPCTCKNHVHAI